MPSSDKTLEIRSRVAAHIHKEKDYLDILDVFSKEVYQKGLAKSIQEKGSGTDVFTTTVGLLTIVGALVAEDRPGSVIRLVDPAGSTYVAFLDDDTHQTPYRMRGDHSPEDLKTLIDALVVRWPLIAESLNA